MPSVPVSRIRTLRSSISPTTRISLARCSNRRMFTTPVVITWPLSMLVTRVIGQEDRRRAEDLHHQAEHPGRLAIGPHVRHQVADPAHLVAGRVEHLQAGQAADEDPAGGGGHSVRVVGPGPGSTVAVGRDDPHERAGGAPAGPRLGGVGQVQAYGEQRLGVGVPRRGAGGDHVRPCPGQVTSRPPVSLERIVTCTVPAAARPASPGSVVPRRRRARASAPSYQACQTNRGLRGRLSCPSSSGHDSQQTRDFFADSATSADSGRWVGAAEDTTTRVPQRRGAARGRRQRYPPTMSEAGTGGTAPGGRPDGSRQPLYLHVGLPKSGTTFLQGLMANNRNRLKSAGFIYPFIRRETMFHTAVELRGQHERWGLRPETIDGTWQLVLDRIRGFGGTGIVSHELLAAATPAPGRAASRVTPPSSTCTWSSPHATCPARRPRCGRRR